MAKMKNAESSEKKWYDEFPKELFPCTNSLSDIDVLTLKDEAKKCLDGETAAFQLKQSKIRDSEIEWLRTALSKGTHADKIAAAIVLIQDNPKYNLSRLSNLISQVKGSKHSQSKLLLTSLRDLFLSDLLHPHHKLLKFDEQSLDKLTKFTSDTEIIHKDASRKKIISHWYYEDQLRDQYETFVLALSAVASDTVDSNREKAIAIMTDLLIANSEQEHKLLELLINKIGDPHTKVASKAVFCLNKLLNAHSNMKPVVLKEIEKLLFRSNIAQRAQYYGICLLTQFVLDKDDVDTATNLINVYFAFFKACLKKGEPDSRMMAAILTGVNRAYRFAEMDTIKLNDHIDSVYKVVHIGSFNVSLSALSLLHQVANKNPVQERRFYTAFYRKLLDPQIGTANKRAVFLNLLYRVMKSDQSLSRLYAFIKRILQVALYFPACMICATLYVISQILKIRQDFKKILLRPPVEIKEEIPDNETNEHSGEGSNNISTDNLNDTDVNIVKADVNTITLPNVIIDTTSEQSEEDKFKIEVSNTTSYDPYCMNPLKSGALTSPIVELTALLDHYHPSVSLFARNIMDGKSINYTGDPLNDLALIRFLDRYVFKNPKKLEERKINKPNDPLTVRAKYTPRGMRSLAVDSAAYLNENEAHIPVDELFLYRYLRNRNKKMSNIKDDDDSDHESVNSEEFNDLLDRFSGKDIEELDFAGNIQTSNKRKAQEVNESDQSDEDLGSEDDFDVDDEDLENLDDIDLDDVDEEISDIEFDDEDDDDNEIKLKNSIQSVLKKNSNKSKKSKVDNVFMSAEEFAEILEKQGQSKHKQGGSNVFSDADGASVRQLEWETKRNERITGKFHGTKKKFNNTKMNYKSNKSVKKFKLNKNK